MFLWTDFRLSVTHNTSQSEFTYFRFHFTQLFLFFAMVSSTDHGISPKSIDYFTIKITHISSVSITIQTIN